MLVRPVSCTSCSYTVTFCSLPEVASDISSGVAVGAIGQDVLVKFGDSRSNHSCAFIIRPSHFVMDNDEVAAESTV